MIEASAIPIVAIPPPTTVVDRSERRRDRARLERAELVRRGDEDHLDGADPAAQRVRRDHRDRGRADVHADHVDEAGDGERGERERDPLRRAPDDVQRAEEDDDGDAASGRRASAAAAASTIERRGERADRGRGAEDAEADRPDVEDVARVDRQQRDPAAEEHGEEIERDRAEQHLRPPDEAEPLDQRVEADRLVLVARAARHAQRDHAHRGDREEERRQRVDRFGLPGEEQAADRRAR